MPIQFTDEKLHQKAIAEAKLKFKIWPSAYASAWATARYRQLYKLKHGRSTEAFKGRSDSLRSWFDEKWKAINSSGKIVGECGSGATRGKVKCLPEAKAKALSKKARALIAKRKQHGDPDPNRTGSAVMVSSRVDSSDAVKKFIVWFSGRNTGAVVHANSRSGAIARARQKKVTGWEGKVDAARLCNERELEMIKKGVWIRTRANGKETGGDFKFRKWLKN